MENKKVIKSDAEWKKILNPVQYKILREGGTELAFKGENFSGEGKFHCIACGNILYSSEAKYNSGTGWPSFYAPLSKDSLIIKPIPSGVSGSEVLCARCEGHHGHVFTDGPSPTGLRFCMNAVVLRFKKD